ncbi:helix-turn-helix domain-containing protein [Frigidibacter sp. ROC022]|uniref:helix-turn-helix domain-containing protein n=1 Tax=Frigidibacter sp. ROC022 TaxID=2971796 RepID=UPI00215AD0CF|nr:helix-turn-helix transcriptional regulator [Frigidibacter sp. ROC022]MCR8723033.1 helix-turn-helix domain-containing protein [Frigidibacter sp. ROC022]
MTEDWYSDNTATFGDRVTAAREAANLTTADLARRLGVRDTTVQAWENDQADPRANRVQMLAGVLNVSLMWILTGEGPGVAPPREEAEPERPQGLDELRAEIRALRRDLLRSAERAGRLDRQLARAFGQPA